MTTLHKLQTAFTDSLFDDEARDILCDIHAGAFGPAQRMQVYRNNVFTGLTEALRSVYPVIEKLVGEGFFLYASDRYIRQHPSKSGDLHAFGDEFGSFLSTFEPAKSLPYLHDVAMLEWFYHEVYHEAESAALDLEALSAVDKDLYGSLCFTLNPASRLIQSNYPVVEIWRVNQDDYSGDQTVDLDAGGVNVLIIRNMEEVELHEIDNGDYLMLAAIGRGERLSTSVNAAATGNETFDLDAFFARFVTNEVLAGFSLATE